MCEYALHFYGLHELTSIPLRDFLPPLSIKGTPVLSFHRHTAKKYLSSILTVGVSIDGGH